MVFIIYCSFWALIFVSFQNKNILGDKNFCRKSILRCRFQISSRSQLHNWVLMWPWAFKIYIYKYNTVISTATILTSTLSEEIYQSLLLWGMFKSMFWSQQVPKFHQLYFYNLDDLNKVIENIQNFISPERHIRILIWSTCYPSFNTT